MDYAIVKMKSGLLDMVCKKCGNKLDDKATVCDKCKTPVEKKESKKDSDKGTIIFFAVVIVIIVAFLILFLVLTIVNNDEEELKGVDTPDNTGIEIRKGISYSGYDLNIGNEYNYMFDDEYGVIFGNDKVAFTLEIDHDKNFDDAKNQIMQQNPGRTDIFMDVNGKAYIAYKVQSEQNNYFVYLTSGPNNELWGGFAMKRDTTLATNDDFMLLNNVITTSKIVDGFVPSEKENIKIDVLNFEKKVPPKIDDYI